MSLAERVDALIEKVAAERSLAPQIRTSEASDGQLEFALQLLRGLKTHIDGGDPPSGQFAHPNLGQMVTESWSLSSPLAAELVEFERLYLSRQSR
jgi:hypothetical protein